MTSERLLALALEIDTALAGHRRGPIRARNLLLRLAEEIRALACDVEGLEQSGLSPSEARFVLGLYARPGTTVGDVVRRLGMRSSGSSEVSRSAEAIVARGLCPAPEPREARVLFPRGEAATHAG